MTRRPGYSTSASDPVQTIRAMLFDGPLVGVEHELECYCGRGISGQILDAPLRPDPDGSQRIVARIEALSDLLPSSPRFQHRKLPFSKVVEAACFPVVEAHARRLVQIGRFRPRADAGVRAEVKDGNTRGSKLAARRRTHAGARAVNLVRTSERDAMITPAIQPMPGHEARWRSSVSMRVNFLGRSALPSESAPDVDRDSHGPAAAPAQRRQEFERELL
jgi:hypothetical protein